MPTDGNIPSVFQYHHSQADKQTHTNTRNFNHWKNVSGSHYSKYSKMQEDISY